MNNSVEHKGNWFFGLILLVVGVGFIIENFTNLEIWGKLWTLWPVILVVWGIKEIWQTKSTVFGIILVAIGSIFLAHYFFNLVISRNIWKFWPILMIVLGIDQIYKAWRESKRRTKGKVKEEEEI